MLADISNVDAIYIVCGRTDMRKSIDGLCAIIQEQFSMEIDHSLYLFCGRKCDRIKAILKKKNSANHCKYSKNPIKSMVLAEFLVHINSRKIVKNRFD